MSARRMLLSCGLLLLGKELEDRRHRRMFESMLADVRLELDRVERMHARRMREPGAGEIVATTVDARPV